MEEPSLKQVERRTYMSYHQDGLLDIFIGVYILLFASGILLSTTTDFSTWFILPGVFPAIMVPIWISVKKRITMPRIGYVRFRSRGTTRLMALLLGLMVAGLGVFALFSFSSTEGWALTLKDLIVSNGMLITGVVAATMSSLFAFTLGLKRLYAYGLVTLTLFFTGHFVTTILFEYILIAIGLVIVVYGFLLLISFIRKYPLTEGGEILAENPR